MFSVSSNLFCSQEKHIPKAHSQSYFMYDQEGEWEKNDLRGVEPMTSKNKGLEDELRWAQWKNAAIP